MELSLKQRDANLKILLDSAYLGLFPFFQNDWSYELKQKKYSKITGQERVKAKKILKRISMHKNFDRQKTIIFSLEADERIAFMKHLLYIVEKKILDSNPTLQ